MSEQHSFELTRNSKFNPPASSPREADRTPRTWPRRNAAPVGTVPLVNSERAEPNVELHLTTGRELFEAAFV
jgi:hypothetical protein